MRRAIAPLSVLLAVQLGLALLLVMRRDPLAGAKLDTPLVSASAVKSADELIIDGKPGAANSSGAAATGVGAAAPSAADSATAPHVRLVKKDGQWVLPDQFDAPADGQRISALLDRLAGLKRGLPLATSEAALRRFKLVDADFERRIEFNAGGKRLDTIYVGESAGLRKSDVRDGADRAVYAVDLSGYELPTEPSAWLNANLLRDDTDKLSELDVGIGPTDKVQLVQQKSADNHPATWTDPALSGDTRVDSAHADALVQQLSQVRVDAVLGTASKPEWQQEHPVLTIGLKDEKQRNVAWILSKPSTGDFYVLKSSAHPWYFSVNPSLAKSIIDAGGRDQLIVAGKSEAKAGGKS